MSYEQVNMLLESQKYSNMQDFIRSKDNREAIASYIIDEGHLSTFFANFPGLMYQEYGLDKAIGDVVKIRFTNMNVGGRGVVGPAKPGRQLAGNEAMFRQAWRETTLSLGVHRYAVAIENLIDKKTLPQMSIAHVLGSVSKRWTTQDDVDSFMTLFRDSPFYASETGGLTNDDISQRVQTLFGRGYNDVGASVHVIFAGDGTKNDIEPGATVTGFRSTAVGDRVGLANTDTLTSGFIDSLVQFMANSLKTPKIDIGPENEPFYSMVIERQDIINLFANSSTTFVKDIKDMSAINPVTPEITAQHPIFRRVIGELWGMKFIKYDQIASGENPLNERPTKNMEFINTVYEDLSGVAIKIEAKVLAAATTGETVSGLSIDQGGYLAAGLTRGVSATSNTYQIFISCGGRMFPYFDGTVTGKDSVNNIDVGLYGGGAATTTYYGRVQIGQGNTATTRYKVVYKGPIYSGTIQVGSNGGINSFVDDAYKLEIVSLHAWNPGDGKFDAGNLLNTGTPATNAANWATFKTFLGINNTTKAIDPALLDRVYQFNRRCHMFDTVKTIAYGKQLMYKFNGGGAEFAQETRDYGAFTGSGLSVVQGKKLVTTGHGLISNYVIVCFKRPPVVL